jgi:hypothetical protein
VILSFLPESSSAIFEFATTTKKRESGCLNTWRSAQSFVEVPTIMQALGLKAAAGHH